jgi:DNA-binding response OmpR family regulator
MILMCARYSSIFCWNTETVLTATALLNSQPFELVICDVNLPDGSGLTVADRAKAAGVKVLVMTGQGLSLKPGSLQPYGLFAQAATRCRIARLH